MGDDMRFGLFLPQGWRLDLVEVEPERHWSVISGLAARADAGVWDSLWVFDHLHTFPAAEEANHEAWALMAALAASTSRVRIGQMCTCMGYRNPALLAKVAATVDIVSGGRLEMGIGAGWYEQEWRAYGYEYPSAGRRLTQLEEGVQIMRDLWLTGTSTFEGREYRTDGALCHPLPLQPGGIPLWIAGGGERRTLRIAARYARYTNFDGTLEGFRRKSAVLEQHCADVGTDFGAITRSADYNVVLGRDEAEVADRLARLRARMESTGASPRQVEREMSSMAPHLPGVGTPEQVVEKLGAVVDAGLRYPIFYLPEIATDASGLELLETEVLPALRAR